MAASRDPFDWVIVEEAAKATGPELAGALALGNRVLLIGDHRQLPPFDASRLNKVFKDGELVRKITSVAPSVAGHLFNDTPLDDLFRLLDCEEFGPKLIRMARSFIEPFRAFAEEDEERARLAHHRRISAVLTEQRRMDPAIARLVSSTFYGGALTTSPERIAEAQDRFAVPVTCLEGLPDLPVVVVDFPHVSRTGQRESAERARPKWHNPVEIDAVIDVLRHVRAAPGRKPSLAVLSPYATQVRLLDERLRAEMRADLSHLGNFAPVREGMGFTGTVELFSRVARLIS